MDFVWNQPATRIIGISKLMSFCSDSSSMVTNSECEMHYGVLCDQTKHFTCIAWHWVLEKTYAPQMKIDAFSNIACISGMCWKDTEDNPIQIPNFFLVKTNYLAFIASMFVQQQEMKVFIA